MSGALDCMHELALMLCACSRDSLRNDLALFGDEALKPLLVLVIDVDFLRVAEPACPLLARHLALFLASWFALCGPHSVFLLVPKVGGLRVFV